MVALLLWTLSPTLNAQSPFIRGDSDANGIHDFTDAINTLKVIFLGTAKVTCDDAADTDDSGKVDFSDPIVTLAWLFLGFGSIAKPVVCGADPTDDSLGCESHAFCGRTDLTPTQRIGHLLNRIAYGPTVAEVKKVMNLGIGGYIQQQLDPESIPENPVLISALDGLTEELLPFTRRQLVPPQSAWHYFKGTQAPPVDWKKIDFDDSSWLRGRAGFGYGDDDDETVLEDMSDPVNGYLTVFLRHKFHLAEPTTIEQLFLRVRFDDGFVAYLNGVEIEREFVNSTAFNAPATESHDAGDSPEEFDVSSDKRLLVSGPNVLAVQLHNRDRDSSDATIDPALGGVQVTSKEVVSEYPDISAVKASAHLRGVYSNRRLQIVLGDFWENHFTTDYDKVAEYLDEGVTNSDGSDAMPLNQAEREAANLEALEYEFFIENALGHFGDLLRFSAKSPTMLIYLDNVLNIAGKANENYSREIKELHAFGVDNGYTQTDIEQGARIFTGWNICKQPRENADNPLARCGREFVDTEVVGLGGLWKYFKGTRNPTQIAPEEPTTEWARIGYDDSTWLSGTTPIGYGDGDEATLLSDMRNGYESVFLRHEFELTADDIDNLESLVLEVNYDDGFVAYINGVQVVRGNMGQEEGTPPNFDRNPDVSREITGQPELFGLAGLRPLLDVGTNVLAAQVHNHTIGSSDLSFRPRVLSREFLPGGVENGDSNGEWAFHLRAREHDSGSKTLFHGRPYQLDLPSHRSGDGKAALSEFDRLIDKMVRSAPVAEFICSKLVQKLVYDVPPEGIVGEAIAAWNSTNPEGHIRTVVEAILTSDEFFDPLHYRAKVKDPLEFVNSSTRVLESLTDGDPPVEPMEDMGMHLFDREDPDGWPEIGWDWISTSGILERVHYVQDLSGSGRDQSNLTWSALPFLDDNDIITASEIVRFFDDLLYEGSLPAVEVEMLVEFLSTDENYVSQALVPGVTSYRFRVEKLVALMLSMPQWNTQ